MVEGDTADLRPIYRQYQRQYHRWQVRYHRFLETRPPIPARILLGTRRGLTQALAAQHAAEQAVLDQRPAFPEVCRGMACGAKTRKGTPCKRRDLYGSLRCKFHGGLSTGPRTIEGKQRSALNGLQPKRKRSP